MSPAPRFLERREILGLLDEDLCRTAVEEAFRQHGTGEAPPPGVLGFPSAGGGFHVKAGILTWCGRPYFAVKVNGNFFENEMRGFPRIQGLVLLADARTGTPLAVLDSGSVTELRTAAATAVAAQHLARPDSSTATIVGCGIQGRAQLRALARVLPLKKVFAFDENFARAQGFAERFSLKGEEGEERMDGRLAVSAARCLHEALVESDVVVTCTPSKKSLLPPRSPSESMESPPRRESAGASSCRRTRRAWAGTATVSSGRPACAPACRRRAGRRRAPSASAGSRPRRSDARPDYFFGAGAAAAGGAPFSTEISWTSKTSVAPPLMPGRPPSPYARWEGQTR